MPATTLIDLLDHAAERARTSGHGLTYVGSDAATAEQPYDALHDAAGRILAGLRAEGVARAERVVVVLPSPQAFFPVFWGCQLGGVVPVALASPTGPEDIDGIQRLIGIHQKLGGPRLICEAQYAGQVGALLSSLGAGGAPVTPLTPEGLIQQTPSRERPADPVQVDADDLAYIQFSSGSTSLPKGVRLSHRNLVANVEQMRARGGIDEADVELSWMPHHHDLGLIGCHLLPLLVGARQVKLDPLQFLRRPARWLDWASRCRATLLSATPSALRLTLRRVTELDDWDLSAVRQVVVGAEPIMPSVLDRFNALLRPCGLRPEALNPSYGLAEGSVGVTSCPFDERWRVLRLDRQRLTAEGLAQDVADAGDAADSHVLLTDLGRPVEGLELRIVDDADAELDERQVGHVQIRGPNVTSGYEGDDAATAAAQCGDWWRTGDQGFLAAGRLAICGRTRDMIFVGGRNLHAIDLEQVAEHGPGVRRAVVVAAPRGVEREEATVLFVVTEAEDWRDDLPALEDARRRVQGAMGVTIDEVVPLHRRQIPRTTSGKVQRQKLTKLHLRGDFAAASEEARTLLGARRVAAAAGASVTQTPAGPGALTTRVRAVWAEVLQLPEQEIALDAPFMELGGTSIRAQELLGLLEQALHRRLDQELLLRGATIAEMVRYLKRGEAARAPRGDSDSGSQRERVDAPAAAGREVAVVGLACRFADASTPEQFWDNLQAGRVSVGPWPAGRFDAGSSGGIRCRNGSFLDDPYAFDPAFFGLDPDEARLMDPQQRLALELSAEALDRAGTGGEVARRVGIFVGASQLPHQEVLTRAGGSSHPAALVGNLLNMIAARPAHELDLNGPALAVDTACSSALVAVHLALESLQRGECRVALAGGVNLNLSASIYRYFEAAGALSPSGRSLPFDTRRDGFVPGEGGALVVLRPLAEARRAGDRVLAVIRGSAMNNDGRSLGAMAPNPEGQRAVLREAWRDAGIDPAELDVIEAHGTGTEVGDLVELRALAQALEGRGGELAVGSVKANLGHLLGAAGIAGLVKVVLSLRGGRFPRQPAAADSLLPLLGAEDGPLRLAERVAPQIAGVSSFGFGGTNCHLVVERAAPEDGPVPPHGDSGPELLRLSAPSPDHLQPYMDAVLRSAADQPLCRAAGELSLRTRRPVRSWIVGTDDDPTRARGEPVRPEGPARVALLFPGQGAQHPHQGWGLLSAWPAVGARLEALCDRVQLDVDLINACYGAAAKPETLQRTDLAQPLLFAFQVAVVEALIDAGLRPAAVLGHSVGEYAAAVAAGMLDVEPTLDFVARRGAAMQRLPGRGGMLAAFAPLEAVAPVVSQNSERIAIGVHNGPEHLVLSGPRDDLERARATLEAAGVSTLPLPVSHAFHSPMMAGLAGLPAGDLRARASEPGVRFVSTVTGELIEAQDLGPGYWQRHIGEPVRFDAALSTLASLDVDAFLEIGPGDALTRLARRLLPAGDHRQLIALCRRPGAADRRADLQRGLEALGELWAHDVELDLDRLRGAAAPPRTSHPLATIPYQRSSLRVGGSATAAVDTLLHREVWIPAPAAAAEPPAVASLLVVDLPGLQTPPEVRATHLGAAEGVDALVAQARGSGEVHVAASGSPAGAAAATLAEALLAEQPGRAGGVCVVDPGEDLAQAWPRINAALSLGLRRRVRLASGELDLRAYESLARVAPHRFPAEGVYLIIGATGGVGSTVAVHLASSGASTIHLTGRRTEDAAVELLEQLQAVGVAGRYHQQDAAAPGALAALVDAIYGAHGRLDGVVHAAGTARMGSLAAAQPDELEAVLAPKLRGVDALAAALEGHPVGFVALMSSLAARRPRLARGLGPYAAANAYLDAVAARQGRPWISMAWTLWGEVGLAAESWRAAAVATITPTEAMAAFDLALAARERLVVIAASDDLRLREEAATAPATAPAPPVAAPEQPSAAEPGAAEAGGSLELLVTELLGRALGRRGGIDVDQSFLTLGLDSLTAVDLVKEIERRTGRTLDVTLLFEFDTVRKLVDHLEAGIDPAPAAQPQPSDADRSTRDEALPLTGAQKTFYANQRFYPELPGYVFMRAELSGPVSADHLDRAVAQLFLRHAMLSMQFEWEAGEVVQRPGDFPAPRVQRYTLSTDAEVEALEHAERNAVFDLGRAPLFRALHVQRGGDRHTLMLNVHHIIADAWSGQLLMSELLELHRRQAAGEPPELPPLVSSFSDCAAALDALDAEVEQRSRAYWARTLADPAPPLALPFDGDPAAEPVGPCQLHQSLLPAQETALLKERARSWGVTLFQAVFASYLLCLRRWSGQDDIVVRVANARREARVPEIERVVGCFADSLPLRVHVDPHEPLPALLERVRRAVVEAQRHPFTSSLELAGVGPGRAPTGPRGISPAGLSFPNFGAPARVGQVEVLGGRAGAGAGFTQLGLIAWELSGQLHFSWNTLAGLFEPRTVQRLADEHAALIAGLARGQIEPTPRPKRSPLPPGRVIHQRFLRRAETVPDAVAVVGQETLRYAELSRRARALGRRLADEGASPGELVGLLARPGTSALISSLGILFSGAAYVPLDPDWPAGRLEQVVQHAGLKLLVAPTDPERSLPGTTVDPDDLPDGEPAAIPREAGPDDLAYVMYTSGTTGRPKGVMVPHRAASLFHDWVHDTFEVSPDDRFIQTSSLAFGGSIRQMYSPLLAGATVLPAPRGLTRDPAALVAFLERHRITIWNSVPTLWMRLLDSVEQLDEEGGRRQRLTALRWILIGGEHVPASHVRRWQARFGGRHRVANLYGSTETIVNATWYEVRAQPADDVSSIPIGFPCEDNVVELEQLDDEGVGRIFVGGPSLARGYLHDEALTREVFVTRPGQEGVLYDTGDLGRHDASGALVYLGRADTQVQVHGNRVELGEIEGVLTQHPAVASALVVFEAGRLTAFVEPVRDAQPDPVTLREHVSAQLPGYMRPHRVELLEQLPRTPAGKLDRKALAARAAQYRPTAPSVAPAVPAPVPSTDQIEDLLCTVWREVLDVERVEPDDDFFALGGDSILALDVLRRLRGRVPFVPRPVTLYGERTVRRLAAAIRAEAPAVAAAPAPEAIAGHETVYPLTPSQRGFVLAERRSAERSPAWSADLVLRGEPDVVQLQRALDQMVHRHPALRTVIETEELRTHQRVLPWQPLPLQAEDLRGETDLQAALARRERDLRAVRFDLERFPLVRLRLVRTADDVSHVFVAVHHVVGDGWSLAVLGSDLLALYDALRRGEAPALPLIRGTYADVARFWSDRAGSDASRSFWRELFQIPWEPPQLPAATGPAGTNGRQLPPERVEALRALGQRRGTGLFLLLLTAWCRALRSITGCDELVLGTATSGRDLPVPDVERIFGCFATGLPLRVRLGGDADADLEAVSNAFTEASRHADLTAEAFASVVPRHPGLSYPPGKSLFFSFLDLSVLPPIDEEASLQIDWSESRFHFAVDATETELMLGVLAGDGLRLHVHGRSAELRERALELFEAELAALEQASLDAAIVCYLPAPHRLASMLPAEIGGGEGLREQIRSGLFPDGKPRLMETLRTELGRSGAIFLPRFADELAGLTPAEVAAEVTAAVALGRGRGARWTSLAGLLASWTGYGYGLPAQQREHVTTGHAATVTAVVMTSQLALVALGRQLSGLDLAVVGFGSIGQAAAALALELLGAPRRLVICDLATQLAAQQEALERLRQAGVGDVITVEAGASAAPQQVYGCDLIIGASSQGGLIDVDALRPGTVVIDDSFPPIVDPDAAAERMRVRGDVLVLSGGDLALEGAERQVHVQVPAGAALPPLSGIPGCRAEALILCAGDDLPAVQGLVALEQARAYHTKATALGLQAAPPHVGAHAVDLDALRKTFPTEPA